MYVFVKFQAIHHPTSSTCQNVLRLPTYKQNMYCL